MQDSVRLAEEALKANGSSVPALVSLGRALTGLGNFSRAEQALRRALSLDPRSVRGLSALSYIARAGGAIPDALSLARRATEIDPQFADARLQMAMCYLDLFKPAEASAELRRTIELDPASAQAHYLLGVALVWLGDEVSAVEQLKRAIDLDPVIPGPYVRLSATLMSQGDPDGAERTLVAALDAAGQRVDCLLALGSTLLDEGRFDRGRTALETAISLEPDNDLCHLILGRAYAGLGRFEESVVCFEKAISLDPKRARTYAELAFAKRIGPEDSGHIETMRSMVANRSLPIIEKRHLHYAIGKAYDDLGNYEYAARHYDEANGLMRMLRAPNAWDPDSNDRYLREVRSTQSRQWMQKHRAYSTESNLPILIVGMIRSGTTLVEQILSCHAEIGAAGELDYLQRHLPRFLSPDGHVDATEARRYVDGYLRTLRTASPGKRHVTDKMPHNFLILGWVSALFPNARIVHVHRDPPDNCLSIYATPFRDALNFAHSMDEIILFYNQYAKLMEHWRKVLPSNRLIDVRYEELVQDTERVATRMVEFCGLAWDPGCLHHEKNANPIRTPSAWQARQPIYSGSIGRWMRYRQWLPELAQFGGPDRV